MKTIILKHLEEVAIIEEIDVERDLYKEYLAFVLNKQASGMKYYQFVIGQCVMNANEVVESISGLSADTARKVSTQILGVILCINPNVFCHEKGWDYTIDSPLIMV